MVQLRFTEKRLLHTSSDGNYIRCQHLKRSGWGILYHNTRTTGTRYERKAADYLKQQGLFILKCNYRCKCGEIDLIARDGQYLVFVEVKYRNRSNSGNALEAVNPVKQRTICKVARYFLTAEYHSMDVPCRFDVVGIDGNKIHWVKNAFEYI